MDAFDQAWRDRLLASDSDAAFQLTNRGLGPVLEFCCRQMRGDTSQTRAVAQMVLIKAMQQIEQYNPESGDIIPWLLAIAEAEVGPLKSLPLSPDTTNPNWATTANEFAPDPHFLHHIHAELCLAMRGEATTNAAKVAKAAENPTASASEQKLTVPCPQCGRTYQVNPSRIRRKVRCSNCDATFLCDSAASLTNTSHDEDPDKLWYVNGESGIHGPYLVAQIRELVSTGRVPYDAQVRSGTSGSWTSALELLASPSGSELPPSMVAPPTGAPWSPVPPPVARRQCPATLGRFQVMQWIGEGAFGAVYRAYDPVLDREVALKVAHASAWENEQSRELIMGEPQAAAKLRHPNIVAVHDAGSHDEQFFVAMEFVSGRTLKQRLAAGPVDQQEAVSIVRDLALALDYAHQTGVVHRDIKPANIMLDDQGHVLLADFGLARIEHSIGHANTDRGAGTPGYMPPEQFSRDWGEVGPASDQYSLGVVLYELLCHQTPFSGPPGIQRLNTLHTEPPSPRTIDPLVPRELDAICQKAMTKQIAARYQSAGHLADDLTRFADGRETLARPWGPAERIYRWCAASPALASALAASVLLLLLLAITLGVTANTERGLRMFAETAKQVADSERKKADSERKKADDARQAAEAAHLAALKGHVEALFDRGITLCEQGKIGEGMTAMAESLYLTSGRSELSELANAIRLNLAAWRPELHALNDIVQHDSGYTVACVAISPEGDRMLTASTLSNTTSQELRLFKLLNQGNLELEWTAPMVGVNTVAFGPNRTTLAGGYRNGDGFVIRWGADGERGKTIHIPNVVIHALATSSNANGDIDLFVGGEENRMGVVIQRDLGEMNQPTEPRAVFFEKPVRGLALHGDKLAVATGDPATSEGEIGLFQTRPLEKRWKEPTSCLNAVVFDAQGSTIVSGGTPSTLRGVVQFWDIEGKQKRQSIALQGAIYDVAINPKGDSVLTASQARAARLLDFEHGHLLGHPMWHRREVRDVEFFASGRKIVTAGDEGAVRIWDAATGIPVGNIEIHPHQSTQAHAHFIRGVRVDNNRIVVATYSVNSQGPLVYEIKSVDPNDSSKPAGTAAELKGPPTTLAFHSDPQTDSERVLVGFADGAVELLIENETEPRKLPESHQGPVVTAAFSKSGRLAVTGSLDGSVFLWSDANTESPTFLRPLVHSQNADVKIYDVAFDPINDTILTAGNDGNLCLWKIMGKKTAYIAATFTHTDAVLSIAFDPNDNRHMVTGFAGGAQLWKRAPGNAEAWERDGPIFESTTGFVRAAFNSKAGIFVSSATDGATQLWDLATKRTIGPPLMSEGIPTFLDLRSDNVVVVGTPGSFRRWKLPSRVDESIEHVRLWIEKSTALKYGPPMVRLSPNAWKRTTLNLSSLPEMEVESTIKTDRQWVIDPRASHTKPHEQPSKAPPQ